MELPQFDFIDMHYHAGPDLYARRYGVLEVGKQYQKLKGAVVLKSHLGSTAIQATIAQQEGLPVFPSVVLNSINGGIRYQSILRALLEYQPVFHSKLIVDLPTITNRKHSSKLSREIVYPFLNDTLLKGEIIFDENNKLKPEVIDILKLTRDYPIILSSGHSSKEEVYALIEAADRLSVPCLLLNQPANPLTGFTAEDLLEIEKNSFVWTEQTALTYLLSYQCENDFCKVLKEVSRLIYSSDLGQTSQMDITEWMKTTNKWFDDFNISDERRKLLCLKNPWHLLKI